MFEEFWTKITVFAIQFLAIFAVVFLSFMIAMKLDEKFNEYRIKKRILKKLRAVENIEIERRKDKK